MSEVRSTLNLKPGTKNQELTLGAQGKLQSANVKVQNGGQGEVISWVREARTLSHLCNLGLSRNPSRVTLNEVNGLLTLVESRSRRFFAALRMTGGGFFNNPNLWIP